MTPLAFVLSSPAVVVEMLMLPTIRLVVEAVVKDPYVVEDSENLCRPDQKLVSDRSVDEAVVPAFVSIYTSPDAFVFSVPDFVVDNFKNATFRFVLS